MKIRVVYFVLFVLNLISVPTESSKIQLSVKTGFLMFSLLAIFAHYYFKSRDSGPGTGNCAKCSQKRSRS